MKTSCNQNSAVQGRDLSNAIFGDGYQLIHKTFMICQRKSYILIKGKLFFFFPPVDCGYGKLIKSNSVHPFFFFPSWVEVESGGGEENLGRL